MKQIILLAILLTSCSTPMKKKQGQHAVELSLYKISKEKKSCSGLITLKDYGEFPLPELLDIQILNFCDLTKEQFGRLTKKTSVNSKSYLNSDFSKAAFPHAKKFHLYEEALIYGHEIIKSLSIKKEKEQQAIQLIALIKKSKRASLIKAAEDIYYKYAPRKKKKLSKEEYYKVARDYERVRNFKKARSYYQKIIKDQKVNHIVRFKSYFRKAMTYKLARDKKTYSDTLLQMMFWIKRNKFDEAAQSDKKLYQSIWDHRMKSIRARWTVGETDKALAQINFYLKKFPASLSETKADLNLLRGQIYREKKNYHKANQNFQSVLDFESASRETLEKASWSLAWNYYLTKNYQKAVKSLQKLISESRSFKDVRKHSYWQAMSYEHLGEKELANTLYKKLSTKDPYGYYGILATYKLGKKYSTNYVSKVKNKESSDNTLKWLKAAEEKQLIKKYLKTKKSDQAYTDFHFAESYDEGLFYFFRLDDSGKEDVYKNFLPLAFPTPYKEHFFKAAKNTKLPLSFLYAIARQESAFNTHARSWADAFGLLQVTPEKAKSLSKKYNITYNGIEDLFTPKINLPLGSLLLKELTKRTSGEFISVVASYNAGRAPVKRWYKTRFRKDPLEFIERIPYRETQNYVKLIFRNYTIYSSLLGINEKNGVKILNSTL